MTAQEMLAEVHAEAELNRLGYFKEECAKCKGRGYRSTGGSVIPLCRTCDGDGVTWARRKKPDLAKIVDDVVKEWSSRSEKPEQETPPVA